jgi:hypothetical protein
VVEQLLRETLGIHAQDAIEVTPSEKLVASAPEFYSSGGNKDGERKNLVKKKRKKEIVFARIQVVVTPRLYRLDEE